MRSPARAVAWNTVAQAAGKVAGLGLSLVTTVLLTRYLGVAGYGSFVTVIVYISTFAFFFDWGIQTIVVRELSQRTRPPAELLGEALTLRFALSLPTALVAALVVALIYPGADDAQVRVGILIALPTILLGSLVSTLGAVFQAELKMARVSLSDVGAQAVSTVVIVYLVATERPFAAIVGATVLGATLHAAFVFSFSRRLVRVLPRVDLGAWKRLFLQALPLGIALLLNTLYFRLDALLLSGLRGAEEVGIYGVAYRFLEMVVGFPSFFVLSVFPLLAAAAKAADWGGLRAASQRSFDVLVLAAVPVALGTIATAPQIVRLVAGAKFEASVTPLRILAVGAALMFVNGLFGYLLIALDRQKDALWLNVAALVFNVGLNVALIPAYGATAAAAVATTSEVLILAGALVLGARFAGFVPALGVTVKALAAGGIMALVIAAADANLAVSIVLGAVVYVAVLSLLRVHVALELRQVLRPVASN